ncbi:MAG: PadR family transcriptional regulator [Tissierellia bacterium]|nr:PadR family transcriptional regulator [Tissierellia bacterium]
MAFPVQGTWLDFCVLSIIKNGDTYGYELTQKLMSLFNLSESTFYPVLRRLSKDGELTTYDRAFDGRNRRYYSITPRGLEALNRYEYEWAIFKNKIDTMIGGGEND